MWHLEMDLAGSRRRDSTTMLEIYWAFAFPKRFLEFLG